MHTYMIFVLFPIITALASFSSDAVAGSKSHGGFETTAAPKKCKKGFSYSEAKRKCIRKGRYGY